MTYLHAIQYLEGSAADAADASRIPYRKDPAPREERLYQEYLSALGNDDPHFLYLLFASDRTGQLSAAYCRAALLCAGIHVGEIGDATSGSLSAVLRIDGSPVSPAILRNICHTARAAEQQILKCAAKSAPRQNDEEAAYPTPTAFSAARRCGAVLPRLFADHDCRVIFLMGDITDPRLRMVATQAPSRCVAVLSAGEHGSVQKFPLGTAEAVCPTCTRATFHRVTDACSLTGSRLTMIATSHLSSEPPTLFSRRFSYRAITDCRLRSGSSAVLRAAMLAGEALLALNRLGCRIPTAAIRQGFADAALPDYLSPFAIEPLLISHAICDDNDIDVLISTWEEFDDVLPPHRYLVCDPSLTDRQIERLQFWGSVIQMQDGEPLGAYLPPPSTGKDLPPVAATYFLLGSPDALAEHISHWQRTVRAL